MTVLNRPEPATPSTDPPTTADGEPPSFPTCMVSLLAVLALLAFWHLAVAAGLLLVAACVTIVLASQPPSWIGADGPNRPSAPP
ncbi:hypothetical protein E7T09_03325 [Deinococcus sp. KSM4-11]|uniref:hypothetical protein n=1 Tax=Deinococcus sp. KSM4-11 TaxID=2568654 RepID=UPI0010A590B5|nr:hypothetical protein [Deinococcus sp. KSM4-11]THF88251.1 hypothetical protein E7T09_03325 [Deinococcus sp. KSM4-11]